MMYGLGGERKLDEHDARPPRAATSAPSRCGSATPPTSRSSTTSGARCWTPSTCTPARATRSTTASGRSSPARSRRRSSTGASPTAASGRCAASPSTSPPRRCSAGSPATAARAWPSCARTRSAPSAGSEVADEIHADVCEHGVDERGVFVQHYDTDALDASLLLMPLMRFLPPDDPRVRATVLAIADELTEHGSGAALPHRGDRRRPARQGGHVPDLLVLARLGAVRDRRARPGAAAVRAAARLRRARSACTPRRSTPRPAATSATSRRRSPTSR